MDFSRNSYRPRTNNRISLLELQEQSQYTLDIHIRKGDRLTGGFGKTFYKAEWIDEDKPPILLIEMKGSKISQEVYLYLTLDHPHIIKTYGVVSPNNHRIDPTSILLLQEYAQDGDLGGLLSNNYFVPEQNVLLEIFIQVADAMVFLSRHGIIHGDLACRNVLVFQTHPHDSKRNLVKVIDFGSTQKDSKSSDTKIDIPVRYVPQEILHSEGQLGYSEKSDVYSFGVCMWEACSSGVMPYEKINDNNEVCRQKLQGQRLTRPNKCDPNIWKLMNLCWNDRPSDRPNFQMIYNQLKNIQNIASSPSSSCLFEVEYKTCDDCNLRYTDAASHLNGCSEQEMTCFKCNAQYRGAIYDNHEKNCNGSSEDIIRKAPTAPANSSNNDRSRFASLFESGRNAHPHQERSSLSSETSTRAKSIASPKSVPENLRKPDKEQLPCEFCDNLIDQSQFRTHQIECNKKDQERIERRRRELEQKISIVQIECDFCRQKYSVEDEDNHLDTCSLSPRNVPDTKPFSFSDRSISVPDFLTTHTPSILLERSTNVIGDNHQSRSSTYLRTVIPSEISNVVETTQPPIQKNKVEPSTFRKFVLRLWPFKKKRTVKYHC